MRGVRTNTHKSLVSSLLIILAMICSNVLSEKITFGATILPGVTNCYLEDIAESIQAVVQIKQNNGQSDLVMTITDPKGKIIVTL